MTAAVSAVRKVVAVVGVDKHWQLVQRLFIARSVTVRKYQARGSLPLTFDLMNPNQYASTDYRGLLLCQVSSHSDQGFSLYHANIHTHVTRTHTS